jgi:release factor glutamine methyltransferase
VARANLERSVTSDALVLPITLLEGSWLAPLPDALKGGVDLVVSNPPYVAQHEWDELDPEVRTEPRHALIAGASSEGTPGLADVEAVLRQSREWLARPGVVVIELAPHQAEAAVTLAELLGYGDVRMEPDLSGRPRALVARA